MACTTSSTYDLVNEKYSGFANKQTQGQDRSDAIAQAFGYEKDDLEQLPATANMGLSCGNPFALAGLRPGETVIDLGSGGGIDLIFAAKKVGATGKVIGLDMSKSMIELATKNCEKSGFKSQIRLIETPITKIPLPDETSDCIISNCVINLVPDADKPQVFREVYRLLKPGGRVAISDILARKPLPESIRNDPALLVGCVAGASLVEEYRSWMEQSGFSEIEIVDAQADVNIYDRSTFATEPKSSGCGPAKTGLCCGPPPSDNGTDYNEWVGSFKIYALKS